MNYTIFMTNKCNLNCTYCYEGEKRKKTISYELLDLIINLICKDKSDDVSVVLHGGEPLLEFEKIKYLINQINRKKKDSKVKYSLTTNGTIMNQEIREYLMDNIDTLSISVDGTEKEHDKNRKKIDGEGSYRYVERNIKCYLGDSLDDITARMTINKDNYKSVSENIIHLINMGFKKISPVINQFDDWTGEQWEILKSELKKLKDFLEDNCINVDVGLLNDAKYKCKNSECDGGVTTMTIDADGEIYPCIVVTGQKDFCIGNIRTGIDFERVCSLHEMDKDKVEVCEGCARYDYCDATRCKIINKYQMGEWNNPSINICKIHNIKVALASE